jgi:trimethylamine:corrinoid methyltransferase-like protein
MLTRENIDIAMEARRLLGIPVTFGQMPVAGGAGPVTVAGSLVQNTAESLAICAMRLAIENMVQPLKSTSAVIDMKHLSHRQSGPDMLLHIIAGS